MISRLYWLALRPFLLLLYSFSSFSCCHFSLAYSVVISSHKKIDWESRTKQARAQAGGLTLLQCGSSTSPRRLKRPPTRFFTTWGPRDPQRTLHPIAELKTCSGGKRGLGSECRGDFFKR